MKPISFLVSKNEAEIIDRIVARAVRIARDSRVDYDRTTATMDVTAVHANGCPLRLQELLEADNFDFNHDVFGIRRHLNRNTGQLGSHFVPRFAATSFSREASA